MFQFTPRRPRGKHSLTSPSVKVSEINQLSRPPRAAAAVQSARLQSQTLRHQEVAMKASPLFPQARRRDEFRVHARTRKLDCASCGKPITHHAGRRPSYCSARCRMREFGKGRSRKAFLGGDTGAPTKCEKIRSNNNALQRAKIQSSTRILGPTSVLTIEVFGRAWQSRTSSCGVAIEVAQLRPRALVNAGRQ
jgi:endogenous inhibitor of DNA gyrase (YacG/DUF329 family)